METTIKLARPAKAAANFFISKGLAENAPLTPMKLQKLLYFAQGWSLAITDEAMFDEQIEAWKYGPVVRSVYTIFRDSGSGPITEPAPTYHIEGKLFKGGTVRSEIISLVNKADRDLAEVVWASYAGMSAAQLVALTHREGTPWYKVWQEYKGDIPKGTDIPRSEIKAYFKQLLAEI